jgi:DNA-binding GntR family transcriptional regulator
MSAESHLSALPPPLAEFIAEKLAAEIEAGKFAPGERLSEETLAERFGVSRAPVREALRLLQRDELVRIEPRRGASVIAFSPEEVNELFEVRAVLYALAVERFGAHATDAELEPLKLLGEAMRTAAVDPTTRPEEFVLATQSTTAWIVDHCGNARLQTLLNKMTRQAFRHFAALAHPTAERRQETARLAVRMIAALVSRRTAIASRIARQIVRANQREVLRQLANRSEGVDAG